MQTSIRAISFLFWSFLLQGQVSSPPPGVPSEVSTRPPDIVIGFVGGFVGHDNLVHSPVQLAARLREDYPTGVYVEAFENRRREDAHQKILQILDTNHDGSLSAEEKRCARIVIYGMSWGASESVTLARELEKDGVPVVLTIQVDSVSKNHEDDALIPANVAEAANFYQLDGLLHGRPEIHAADAARTRIIGNFRFEYGANPISCDKYPWYDRVFAKSHTEIECDARVWSQVESLIRSKLPQAARSAKARLSAQ